jgi:NADH:ubiquinone oxidoreductase subunit F (NADH-binding)/NADH:ubiquinone oxidoreductase subunit E
MSTEGGSRGEFLKSPEFNGSEPLESRLKPLSVSARVIFWCIYLFCRIREYQWGLSLFTAEIGTLSTGDRMLFDDLRAIQREFGYLPPTKLKDLAASSGIPLHRVHEVASFYPIFHLEPQPRINVGVCVDLACHLRGADSLCARLKQRFLSHSSGVGVRETSCLGQCDGAPALSINDTIMPRVRPDDAENLIAVALSGVPVPHVQQERATGNLASEPYAGKERYGALRRLVSTADGGSALAELKAAGLAGMGGAGFPAHLKWDIVRNAPGDEKYVVCNADESEPGSIKDRFILERLPHLVVEGMIIAAFVAGAQKGYIYIRHEYEHQAKILEIELEHCRRHKLLGDSILGGDFAFDIEIFVSPGGYICGEGSALLEALEGKRAEPRNRPPNSATHGLWQKPTVLNNVETFAIVPQILEMGVDWFRAQGRGGAHGLKFVAVTGDVRYPGVFEIPLGTPVSEVIVGMAGGPPPGRRIKAFAPSGAASGFLPASKMDLALDFKSMAAAGSMLGSGSIVVLSDQRCMLDMALNAVKFFRNESCGKCVPCRIGSQKMVSLLTGWTRGVTSTSDRDMIDELSEALKLTSICGLGQFIPYPIQTVLRNFPDEVDAHVIHKRCPAGVCTMRREPFKDVVSR